MPIRIELTASYVELPVKFDNKVPTNAMKRPIVAAKSSITIAIRGPSVDSFSNLNIDLFSSPVCLSCLTALYKTYDSRIIDTVKTIIDIYKFFNSCG